MTFLTRSLKRRCPRRLLYRIQSGFTGAYTDRFLYLGDENLSIADPPGLGGTADGVDRLVDHLVAEHDLDFHFRQEIHNIFGAAIEFGMALLAAEPLGLGDRDALKSD